MAPLCCPHMWSRNKINSVLATIYFISAPHVQTALRKAKFSRVCSINLELTTDDRSRRFYFNDQLQWTFENLNYSVSSSAILVRSSKPSRKRFTRIPQTGFRFVKSIALNRKILKRFRFGLVRFGFNDQLQWTFESYCFAKLFCRAYGTDLAPMIVTVIC